MSVIFTIGYERTDLDRFIATLQADGVRRLADVRAVPVSRKAGFSKRGLSMRLAKEGIEYFHFVALGNPKQGRDAARRGQFDLFQSIYAAHMQTDGAQVALRDLAATARAAPTCLMCFERNPATCHRAIVADAIRKAVGFDILNLFPDESDRYVRNAEKLPRFHSGEGATAA